MCAAWVVCFVGGKVLSCDDVVSSCSVFLVIFCWHNQTFITGGLRWLKNLVRLALSEKVLKLYCQLHHDGLLVSDWLTGVGLKSISGYI